MALEPNFRLNPLLDKSALLTQFRQSGRLHIKDFLEPQYAATLHEALKTSSDWRLLINQETRIFELDRRAQAALSPEAKLALEQAVHAKARYDFQYLYEVIRVSDEQEARDKEGNLLNQFATFLCSSEVLDFFKEITGFEDISFADAQATAYGLGHFLTAHDDKVDGKHRRAAYVYNLTPRWRSDWGGLLAFHDDQGHISQAFKPTFNALNIFAVPQAHSVTMVTPFAASRRYSVTGWLRSQPE